MLALLRVFVLAVLASFSELPPFIQSFLDLLFGPLFARLVIALVRTKIILGHEMVRKIVGVLVPLAVAQPFRSRIIGIAQVLGDRQGASGFDVLYRGIDRHDRAVA